MQQAVVQLGALDNQAFGQDETALELPGGDAAVQEHPVGFLGAIVLAALDDQLVVGQLHAEVVVGKAGHGQRDPQAILADLLDVVGRVPLGRHLRDAVQGPFETAQSPAAAGC